MEGDVICAERAYACVCAKPEGHEDGVHACGREGCGGSWTGVYGGGDFHVVAWPLSALDGLHPGEDDE